MKIYKKALAWLLCLTMLVTMSTGVAFAGETDIDPAAAGTETSVEEQALPETEEPSASEPVEPLAEDESGSGSITFVAGDETVVVTADKIKAATSVTTTDEDPWGYKGKKFIGTFYSLESILDIAGIGYSGAHGITTTASDGFTNGFSASDLDDIYIYDQGEVKCDGTTVGNPGTYGTELEGTAGPGNKWAKSIVSITVSTGHVRFVKDGVSNSNCAICSEELFEQEDETLVTLQDLVTAAGDGGTAAINRDVDYGTATVTITVPEGKTVTLDLDGNTLTAGTLEAKGGTLKITNGTVKAKLEGTIVAVSGKYSIEVPAAMCDEKKVPVYSAADGLYEVKEVSAYESQKTANELEKTIASLQAQIEQLTAKIKAGSVAVSAKAVATAYNSVTLTWEGNQPADGFRVEKKIDGVWTEVTTVTEGKYVDKGEPGITNEYRVAPYALYGDNQKEYGKYVTASAKPGLGKAAIYSLASKSKKLTTKWRTVSGAASYDVYIGTNSSVTKGLVKYTNVKSYYKISKKLKKGKTYYVKVRARVTNSQGKVVYGAWSTVKKIKCK